MLFRSIVKRVVALPGDSVYLDDFVVRVREKGSAYFLTEYELSGKSYDIRSEGLPEGWSKDMPLSGASGIVTLGDDEYFVVGDNRLNYSDSRFFGPVHSRDILGKVAFRYWPLGAPAIE